METILLNKKPFGRFLISHKAFYSVIKTERWEKVDEKFKLVRKMGIGEFNKIHGLDWSSPKLFFTEKYEEFFSHAALPIFWDGKDEVSYFEDSVEKNGLTYVRSNPILIKIFKRLKYEFNSDKLDCFICMVPFLEDLKIERDGDGIERFRY